MNKFLRSTVVSLACILALASSPGRADVDADVRRLQERWAEVNYQLEGKTQLSAFEQLAAEADVAVRTNPGAAEPLIWRGIIKSTYAGAKGGLGALALAKDSKADLEQAMEINPEALQGSAYTSLGALYYSVPGWPLGFGDDKKAEALLKKALELNPEGIDSNYFYATFLIDQRRYDEARPYLLKAQQAAPRPGRALADSGRQGEISQKLMDVAGR
jgi:tetratricopeptide (TPR) repeat protein